jgi:hypothetical protein
MAADVQDWLDGTMPTYGWILIGDETAVQTAKKYHSADSLTATAGQRPHLVIRYLPTTAVEETEWMNYNQ